jgi:hypothetical protein
MSFFPFERIMAMSNVYSGQSVLRPLLNIQTCLAIITVVNAIFVTCIICQQHRVSKAKLKLELFERRHRIYESFATYLSEFFTKGNADHNRIDQFLRETRDTPFFFGKDIISLREEISKLSYEHDILERPNIMQGKIVQERTELFDKQRIMKDRLTGIDKNLSVSFGQYLNFERWK